MSPFKITPIKVPDTEPDVKPNLLMSSRHIKEITLNIPEWFLRYHTVKITKTIQLDGDGVRFMVWGWE